MRVPKDSLQNCRKVYQVSESYHINTMTPNSTAAAPKMIRPYKRRLHTGKVTEISAADSEFAVP
jgi:hypothetical protein